MSRLRITFTFSDFTCGNTSPLPHSQLPIRQGRYRIPKARTHLKLEVTWVGACKRELDTKHWAHIKIKSSSFHCKKNELRAALAVFAAVYGTRLTQIEGNDANSDANCFRNIDVMANQNKTILDQIKFLRLKFSSCHFLLQFSSETKVYIQSNLISKILIFDPTHPTVQSVRFRSAIIAICRDQSGLRQKSDDFRWIRTSGHFRDGQ